MAKSREVNKQEPKIGRPTKYTQKLGDKICAQIAEGKSLRRVCENDKMPHKSTVIRWLGLKSMFIFRDQYAHAKRESADVHAEDLLDIAEEAIEAVNGLDPESRMGNAIVQAYKLKADNLKWAMAKLKPKKYGEKIDLTSDGKRIEQTPVVISNIKKRDVKAET